MPSAHPSQRSGAAVVAGVAVSERSAVPLIARLRTARGQADPWPIYEQLRSMGEVIRAPWGGHIVTSFGVCDEVLRSRRFLVPDAGWRARQGPTPRWTGPSSTEMSRTLLGLNPPDHTRVRRSIGAVFDHAALQDLTVSLTEITGRLLGRFAGRLREVGQADFCALVAEELPTAAIGGWLHLPAADHALLRDLTHEQAYAQELLPTASQLAQSDAATAALHEYVSALVRRRREAPGDDPVSGWLAARDALGEGRAAAGEGVYYLTLLIILAAVETTTALLSTMALLLVLHPDQWAWLAASPEHIPAAVDEVLRYDAPTHVISRAAATDTVLAGTRIAADEMVHLMVGAANRDPARFHHPERFDVRQPRSGQLAFSAGVHYCLGAALARLEARILLEALLRGPRLVLAGQPEWAPRVVFRRMLTLPLAADPEAGSR